MSAMLSAVNATLAAQNLMSQYYVAGKGYITVTDINKQWSAQGQGNMTVAQNAIAGWDVNGDG